MPRGVIVCAFELGRPRPLSIIAAALLGACDQSPAEKREIPGNAGDMISGAEVAAARGDIPRAERLIDSALARDLDPDRRGELERALGRLSWRLHLRPQAARDRFALALRADGDRARFHLEVGRLEESMGRFDQAAIQSDSAYTAARDPAMRLKAALSGLNALTKPLVVGSCTASANAHDSPLTGAASRLHAAALATTPYVDVSAALVTATLLIGDGKGALRAWRDYFGAGGADLRNEPLASENKALSAFLPTWTGRWYRAGDRETVALALVRSGFVDEAAFIARCGYQSSDTSTADASLRDIAAYAEFVRGTRTISDSHYRSDALGAANWKLYRARFDTLGATLWKQVSWPSSSKGRPPSYTLDSLRQEILSRFGAEANLSWTDRHYGLVLAHRVVDERRLVREYGRETPVRYVVLDRVVSNGFSNWLTDGGTGTGGWVNTDTMIAVFRSGLVRGPANLWNAISNDTTWAKTLRTIARDSADDFKRAGSATVFAPSVRSRIMRDGAIGLRDSLRRSGLTGDTLARAFISEVARGLEEVNFLHEGRHILDRGDRSIKSSDGEYRAKLSEVALSSRPWISFEFSGILQPNVGDSTPHGTANARIAREISSWIGAHAAEVRGSHLHGPSAEFGSMLNLPLLTEDQLRRAFASLDPWAAGSH